MYIYCLYPFSSLIPYPPLQEGKELAVRRVRTSYILHKEHAFHGTGLGRFTLESSEKVELKARAFQLTSFKECHRCLQIVREAKALLRGNPTHPKTSKSLSFVNVLVYAMKGIGRTSMRIKK